METLVAVLVILVAIAILFEVARRIGVPYPTLFVLGGLGLAFVPGLPRVELEPDLVLLVFLPAAALRRRGQDADARPSDERRAAPPPVDRSRGLHDRPCGRRRG